MEKNRNLDRVMEPETISKNGASSKSRMSRGNILSKSKFALLHVLAGVLMILTLTVFGCSGSGGGSYKIKMTTESGGYISLHLTGTGIATIDWGDGSEKVSLTLHEYRVDFIYTYPSASIRTITINGDMITGLDCSSEDIISLDVSKNTELAYLKCGDYQLTSLDLSKNTALKMLELGGSQLTNIDLSKNTALKSLTISSIPLITSLDLSKNTELTELSIGGTSLTSLDVSKNIALTELRIGVNQLASLDVSKNTALLFLNCERNQLTSLDVSKNTALKYLTCNYNQLTNLDLRNNLELFVLDCESNQLTTNALNALFGTLHSNTINVGVSSKMIFIDSNPGSRDCDRSIAESKGWKFEWKRR